MPSLESDETTYSIECETTLSTASSKVDFPTVEDGGLKLTMYYGSTTSALPARTSWASLPKDPERCPLLQAPTLAVVLSPAPTTESLLGLTRSELAALVDDPFWRRVRTALLGCYWLLVALLIAAAAWIVAVDPDQCPAPPPQQPHPLPMPPVKAPNAEITAEPPPLSLLLHAIMSKY